MPLARARCRACSLPLGDAPHVPVAVTCTRCGLTGQVPIAADGQPAGFEASLTPAQLAEWFAYARGATAAGTLGVVVGACAACRAPVALAPSQPVSLPCPHCGEAVEGPASEVLVDQWTEPWARVSGGEVDAEYRLVMLEDASGTSAGCAACGTACPPGDPKGRCPACGAIAWTTPRTPGGSRLQLAVRVDGTRGDVPFKSVFPVITGEAMLRAEAARGVSARSGTSLVNVTAVGCASALGIGVLLAVLVAIAFHHC